MLELDKFYTVNGVIYKCLQILTHCGVFIICDSDKNPLPRTYRENGEVFSNLRLIYNTNQLKEIK